MRLGCLGTGKLLEGIVGSLGPSIWVIGSKDKDSPVALGLKR